MASLKGLEFIEWCEDKVYGEVFEESADDQGCD